MNGPSFHTGSFPIQAIRLTRRSSSACGAAQRYPSAGRREQRARGSSDLGANGGGWECARPEPRREKAFPFQSSGEILARSGHAATPSDWPNQNLHPRGGLRHFEQLHQSILHSSTCHHHPPVSPIPPFPQCPILHPASSGCSRRIMVTDEQGLALPALASGDGQEMILGELG